MAFEIIPYSKTTKITISYDNSINGNYIYYNNVVAISLISPDESKIVTENDSSYDDILNRNLIIIGTTKYNGNYTIEKKRINGSNAEIRIPIKYLTGVNIEPSLGQAYICKKQLRVCKIEQDQSNGFTIIHISGDNFTDLSVGTQFYINTSNGLVLKNIDEILVETPTNSIISWMENELYAIDNHTHVTMTHTIMSEPRGGDFFNHTGTNKNGTIPSGLGLIFAILGWPIMAASTTFKSHIDGRVRTIMTSLHPPETAMVTNFTPYFKTIATLGPIALASGNPYKNFLTSVSGIRTIRRMSIAFNTALKRLNWEDLFDEISFFKNSLINNDQTRLKLISNSTYFTNYFPDPRQVFNKQTEVLRCLVSLEGGHPFDMDTKTLNTLINYTEPANQLYGGFDSSEIDKVKDRLDMLMLDPYSPNFSSFTPEQKKFAVGLVCWTPMHHYWNGMGGHCSSMPYTSFAYLTMPNQKRFMEKTVGGKIILGNGESIPDETRGFHFDKNTHLTELGRKAIKHGLITGLIIDIKHTHPLGRNQILNMAERGFDYPPQYNTFGNPKTVSELISGAKPSTYFEELVPCSGSSQESNLNSLTTYTKNLYQITATHAALSFVDDNATCADFAFNEITNNQSLYPITLTGSSKQDFLSFEKYIIRAIQEKRSLLMRPRFNPDDILNNFIEYVNNDVYDETDNSILDPAPETKREKIKDYIKYFYLTHIIRIAQSQSTTNLSNNEIKRIIELKGVIGVTSEDRVLRNNERMFRERFFMAGNKNKKILNINMWPIYGINVTKKYTYETNEYLHGEPISNNNTYMAFDQNDARIPLEDSVAWGQGGIFNEIQSALEFLNKETRELYPLDLYYKLTLNIRNKLFKYESYESDLIFVEKQYLKFRPLAAIEALYRSIDQIARVAREKVYYASNLNQNLSKYSLNIADRLDDNDPSPGDIGIRTKLKKYYENITISSDFDGIDDPLDLFASPRMYPIMVLYISNRLKWDLYRRYCSSPTSTGNRYINKNDTLGPERGQKLNVDEGHIMELEHFRDLPIDDILLNNEINEIVREIMKQILDTNFINMVAYANSWATPMP